VVINGAMQVAQRGTSATGATGSNYFTVDRYVQDMPTGGVVTQTQEADAPTGSGFRNSLKMLVTTAVASPGAAVFGFIQHKIEGQNVQQFAKGTASAKPYAVSFWVKSNVTGTYVAAVRDVDNSRVCSGTYTINASATWEKKTIIFPADTTGVINNDNGESMSIRFWNCAGSNFTSGTLNTTWAASTAANLAVGQTNVFAATNNYWQVTGVQLEVGSVATPFEFEDFSTTLAKCQRYYEKSFALSQAPVDNPTEKQGFLQAQAQSTISYLNFPTVRYAVVKRATPTLTLYNPGSGTAGRATNCNDLTQGYPVSTSQGSIGDSKSESSFSLSVNNSSLTNTDIAIHWAASSEL
jgi:hypothetical protein